MALSDEVLSGNAIKALPPPSPLISGVLDLDTTAVLYGPSGKGKSFVALDWACCVATGIPWHGHTVIPLDVLYVLGEGLSGTADRYNSWQHIHTVTDVPNLHWAPRAPNILDLKGRTELLECVERFSPGFVILDTLARHIPGGDENDFATMSVLVQTMDMIRRETSACVLAVHHTGKDDTRGARGHSSLKGAMDTEILCTDGPILTATKQKNHPDGHIIETFELKTVLDSMVLIPKKLRGGANDEKAIRALGECGGEATYNEWLEAAVALGMASGSFHATARRTIDKLKVVGEGSEGGGASTVYYILKPT